MESDGFDYTDTALIYRNREIQDITYLKNCAPVRLSVLLKYMQMVERT